MSEPTEYDRPNPEWAELQKEMRSRITYMQEHPPGYKLPIRDRPVCPYCIEKGQSPRRKTLMDSFGRPLPACNLHIHIPGYVGLNAMPSLKGQL